MSIPPSASWPGHVAVGIVRGEPPLVFLAESEAVLGRLVATEHVARQPPEVLRSAGVLDAVRSALREQRWAECISLWMLATGEVFDGYPDERAVSEETLELRTPLAQLEELPVFGSRT